MFDFGWSEIALIGVVALVLIGPKDLPIAIRAVTDVIKKMRRMAGELQGHVDEMLREADLKEAHDTFRDLRGGGLRDKMFRAIDGDGSIRKTLDSNPLPKDDILGLKTGLGRPAGARSEGTIPMTGPALGGAGISLTGGAPAAPSFVPPVAAGAATGPGRVFPAPPAFIPPSAREPVAEARGEDVSGSQAHAVSGDREANVSGDDGDVGAGAGREAG